jgi:phospholipid-binding lipoprotein MlaA
MRQVMGGVSWYGRGIRALALVLLSLLGACATPDNPDPMESYNRKVFAFNEAVDRTVLKPAATGWQKVTPEMMRTGLDHFFNHLKDLWSAFNLVLQGHPGLGMQEVTRFGVNTVFGLGGFLDPASDLGLTSQHQDFGLTLARWGVPSGAYIVWPFLGPSTVRDSVGLPVEVQIYPEYFMEDVAARNMVTVVRVVNTRATLLEAIQTIDDISLDKYLFIRDGYLQRRESQVENTRDLSARAAPSDQWVFPAQDEGVSEALALGHGDSAIAPVMLARAAVTGPAPIALPSVSPAAEASSAAEVAR